MRILAISGSLRASSSNTHLLRALKELAPAQMEIDLYEGLGELPHFTPDLDDDKSPESVRTLRELLQAADGVVICTPEYAFGVPGTLKNALDWTVSTGDLNRKPVAVISASPLPTGGDKAQASLLLTLTALGSDVPEAGKLKVGAVKKKINAEGEIVDPETVRELKAVLAALEQVIKQPSWS